MTGREVSPKCQIQHQRSLGDYLASTVKISEEETRPRTSGLPVARLLSPVHDSSVYYAVTAIDNRGRLADRSVLRVLGWLPHSSISINVLNGFFIVVTHSHGPATITRQGHLRLPAAVRHSCRIKARAQLLVAAYPDHDLLTAYPTSVLDKVLLAYHESQPKEAGP